MFIVDLSARKPQCDSLFTCIRYASFYRVVMITRTNTLPTMLKRERGIYIYSSVVVTVASLSFVEGDDICVPHVLWHAPFFPATAYDFIQRYRLGTLAHFYQSGGNPRDPITTKGFSRGQVVNSLAMLLLLLFLHHAHPWLADMQWRQGL